MGVVGLALACTDGNSVVGGAPDASSADLGPTDLGPTDLGPTDLGPTDLGVDAPEPLDAPDVVDVPVDVPFVCTANAQCAGHAEGGVCDVATGRCVQCLASADTCPAGQYCVASTNACAPGCRSDEACRAASSDGGAASPTTRCDTTTRACVACLANDDCPLGNLCVGNLCVTGCSPTRGCPADQACCSGACVNTQSNVAACGGCDTRCTLPNAVPACMNGNCAVTSCTPPYADCDTAAANGCEVNTQTDLAHCGGCGMACAARPNTTARCAAGACAYECVTGFSDCNGDPADGCEVDTRVAAAHCGRCGNACSLANATSSCVASACAVASCTTGFADCDGNAPNGCEANTRSDLAHCGGCGMACAARPNGAPVCVTGVCGVTCLAGYADCDGEPANGCESNTPTDLRNCGGCGRACSTNHATASCRVGVCAIESCEAGFGNCDGDLSNGCEVALTTSNAHCGACGHACLPGAACAAGACVLGPYGSGADAALTPTSGTVTINLVRSPATAAAGSSTVTLTAPTGFSVGQMVFLHQTQGAGAGSWEVRQIVALAGGAATVEAPLTAAYSSAGANRAQAVVMPQYSTVAINGATLVAPAWDGNTGGILAFAARDSVRVMGGGIVMSERGFRGHPRVSSNYRPGEQGEGTLGFGVQNTAANGNGGGGGGRTDCECCWAGGGGGGGHAAGGLGGSAGGAVCQPGGNAGLAVGSGAQSPMFFGGAGANGGADEDGYGSAGANGGGIIYIASPALSVESPGAIRANGQTGQNEYNFAGCGSGGGGGGAGGAVYLRVASVNLGASLVTASGGVGGNDPGNCGTAGGDGSVGRITVRGSSTTSGTTAPAFTAVP